MPRSYSIKSDGKMWRFTPGENGSLISEKPVPGKGFEFVDKPRAKTVPVSEQVRKKRMNLAPVLLGSNRG